MKRIPEAQASPLAEIGWLYMSLAAVLLGDVVLAWVIGLI